MNSTRTAYFTTLNSCPQPVVLMESLRSSNEVWERSVEGISGQVIGTPARIQTPLNVEGVVWRRRRLRSGVIWSVCRELRGHERALLGGSRRGERRPRLRTQSPVPEPKVSRDDIPSTASHAARATSCNRLDASAVNRQEQEDRSKLDEQQENISWRRCSSRKNNQADAEQQYSRWKGHVQLPLAGVRKPGILVLQRWRQDQSRYTQTAPRTEHLELGRCAQLRNTPMSNLPPVEQ
jgi:hypothetical protein